MKPAILGIIIIIILLIIGIFFALIAFSYTQIYVTLDDVTIDSVDWTSSLSWSTLLKLGLDILGGNWLDSALELVQGINLNFVFAFTNNGILPVFIPDLSYDLFINDVYIGKGHHTAINATINLGETKEIPILQNFQKEGTASTIKSIAEKEGIIKLHISGIAHFKLIGLIDVPIPFESTHKISIIDEIEIYLDEILE